MGIAWRVHELAAQRGWRTADLASRAGIDVKTARNILTGRATRVDIDTIARIAEALGVTPGALWRTSMEDTTETRWAAAAGAAGVAGPGELRQVLSGGRDADPDPALERATRVL